MERAVVGSPRLQEETQEWEVEPKAFQAQVGEGLVRRARTRISTMRHQQPRDLEAEAVDHLGLLLVSSDCFSEQKDDEAEDCVTIFGGGFDIGS